jgi:hypothetical protein
VDSFPDSSEDVLNDLDPLSRALLDLSVQRGMDDAEIAQVLGTDEASVFEVRVGLLRSLAERVAPEHADAELPELEAAVAERLYPEEVAAEEEEPEAEREAVAVGAEEPEAEPDEPELAEPEAEPDEPEAEPDEPELAEPAWVEERPEDEPQPVATTAPAGKSAESRRRSLLPIILPILLLVAVVAVILAIGSGGDEDSETSEPAGQQQAQQPEPKADEPKPEEPKPEEPKAEQPKPTRLTALGSGDATGTATIEGERLTMTLRGLPDAGGSTYTVWLYDSVIEAEQLETVKNGKVQAKLPKNADEYEFLDVSLEPEDGNPNHSGQSVLRVPLSKLEGR